MRPSASSAFDDGVPEDRLRFETLISDTSANLLHASPQVRGGRHRRRRSIRQAFFQADRCALLAVNAGGPSVNVLDGCRYADRRRGRRSKEINLAELFPWTYRKLVVDRVPVFTRLDEMPPEAAWTARATRQLGIRSALAVPLAPTTWSAT